MSTPNIPRMRILPDYEADILTGEVFTLTGEPTGIVALGDVAMWPEADATSETGDTFAAMLAREKRVRDGWSTRDHAIPGLTGVKDDAAKPRVDLIDPEFLLRVGEVMAHGSAKYGDRNWQGGMPWGRLYAALQRHLLAFWAGEEADPDTGAPHLIHAACCLQMLYWMTRERGDLDDRHTYEAAQRTDDHDPRESVGRPGQHPVQEQ